MLNFNVKPTEQNDAMHGDIFTGNGTLPGAVKEGALYFVAATVVTGCGKVFDKSIELGRAGVNYLIEEDKKNQDK